MATNEARERRGREWSWALYDWANSAFATTVLAGFFPLFFKAYWARDLSSSESTFQLGIANSAASLAIMLLAPWLGAVSDRAGNRKRFLASFATLGVVSTGALYLVASGEWPVAMALFAFGVIGFSGSIVFYDALLVSVATPGQYDRVSAKGYALGYLGGGLLFLLNVAMVLAPERFGLDGADHAVRVSFVTVAVWWAAFSLPLMLRVQEDVPQRREHGWEAWRRGWFQLTGTLRDIRAHRAVFLFLIAYWLYIDGVDTVVRMAVDYGLAIGLAPNDLIVALLITQFVGFPSAIAFGAFGSRVGPRRGIFIAIAVYLAACLWGYFMRTEAEFYALAVVIGLVQGGIQALSRSLFARMVPAGKSGQFFGFYNMLGKFAAVIGPALMGAVSYATGNPRASILAVMVLFVAGAVLLSRVEVNAAG